MFVRHPYLLLELPSTFRPVSVTDGVLYAFRDGDIELSVRIEICADVQTARARVDASVGHFENVKRVEEGHTFAASFTRKGSAVIEHRRIGTTLVAMPSAEIGSDAFVHPVIAISVRASSDPDGALARLVARAVIAPHVDEFAPVPGTNARVQVTTLRHLYPWVVAPAYIAQRDALFSRAGLTPEGQFGLPPVGDGLFLALAQDHGDGIRVLFPSDVARDSLDWSRCLEHAKQNLLAKVGTHELPLAVHDVPTPSSLAPSFAPWRGQPLDEPGDLRREQRRVLVVGESTFAASCIALPELWTGAAERLGTDHLMALVPHRDRLFVFADRGEVANAQLAHAIRLVERDATQVLSPTMFRLEPRIAATADRFA